MIIRAEDDTPATLAIPPGLPVAVSDSHFVGHHPAVSTDHRRGRNSRSTICWSWGTTACTTSPGPSTPARPPNAPTPGGTPCGRASGYEAGVGLAADPDVTAVFAANDEMAVGVMSALADAGVPVPGRVSVVGFDDIPLAPYYRPALTTVRQDFDEIGRTLVDFLLRQIRDGAPLTDEHHLVPAQLIKRASTGAAVLHPPRSTY
ncbi:substrate-binding domain-containing protein [Actinoplanes sp. NPDC051411]|uniref:substrate-binding domain-containing protein n=1 Tax=Actinoplanes sp. NPDC051411 TaxID=3155522 RepID=UPI0034153F34